MTKKVTMPRKISIVREYARNNGMTLKKQLAYVNGAPAYMLVCRKSRRPLVHNLTIGDAYDKAISGDLAHYAPQDTLF